MEQILIQLHEIKKYVYGREGKERDMLSLEVYYQCMFRMGKKGSVMFCKQRKALKSNGSEHNTESTQVLEKIMSVSTLSLEVVEAASSSSLFKLTMALGLLAIC